MNNKKHIYFNTRDELTRINLDEVMYASSDGNYVQLFLRSGRRLSLLASMQNLEQLVTDIPDRRFIRIGRSHLINTTYLSQVNSLRRTIILADDETKETATISVSKDSIRLLRQHIAEKPLSPIPSFQTSNGKMEVYTCYE